MNRVIDRVLGISIFIGIGVLMMSCSRTGTTLTWNEEVRLNDGRTVVVSQERHCEPGTYTGDMYGDCISRESWVTVRMPEFSSSDIVWHEKASPMVLNVYGGNLYSVGFPVTQRESIAYGNPKPPYVAFIFKRDHWERIPFNQIPTQIYDANVFPGNLPTGEKYLTWDRKLSSDIGMRGSPSTAKFLKRVDPKFDF
jgi:hypothetical protein